MFLFILVMYVQYPSLQVVNDIFIIHANIGFRKELSNNICSFMKNSSFSDLNLIPKDLNLGLKNNSERTLHVPR